MLRPKALTVQAASNAHVVWDPGCAAGPEAAFVVTDQHRHHMLAQHVIPPHFNIVKSLAQICNVQHGDPN